MRLLDLEVLVFGRHVGPLGVVEPVDLGELDLRVCAVYLERGDLEVPARALAAVPRERPEFRVAGRVRAEELAVLVLEARHPGHGLDEQAVALGGPGGRVGHHVGVAEQGLAAQLARVEKVRVGVGLQPHVVAVAQVAVERARVVLEEQRPVLDPKALLVVQNHLVLEVVADRGLGVHALDVALHLQVRLVPAPHQVRAAERGAPAHAEQAAGEPGLPVDEHVARVAREHVVDQPEDCPDPLVGELERPIELLVGLVVGRDDRVCDEHALAGLLRDLLEVPRRVHAVEVEADVGVGAVSLVEPRQGRVFDAERGRLQAPVRAPVGDILADGEHGGVEILDGIRLCRVGGSGIRALAERLGREEAARVVVAADEQARYDFYHSKRLGLL